MTEKKTEGQRGRSPSIDLRPDEFREVGRQLVDDIASLLETIRERPVTYDEKPSELDALLPTALPQDGMDAGALLREAAPLLFDHSLLSGHPRYMAYIVSSPAPVGVLGDLLAAAVNANCGGWQIAQMAAQIELQCLRWIAELIGYPSDCGGIFVSGGNMANMVGVLAARRAQANWQIRESGLRAGDGPMLMYTTSETHTWVQKAADLFGFGTDSIRTVPMVNGQRADVAALEKMIRTDRAEGGIPFVVVASAGTVGTGAVDPIADIADLTKELGVWLHVDGAYGAPAAMLPEATPDLRAVARADSVAIDPHKWFYAPVEAGVTLVRDREALPNAFSYRPPYYSFHEEDEPQVNFYEWGPQNSRHFRALKVWLQIRHVGRRGYQKLLERDIRLAEALFAAVERHEEMEAVTQNLSITTFRYVPADVTPGKEESETYLNELNEELLGRIKTSGELFVSNTVIDGKFVLRSCIVNFRTELSDIEAIPKIVVRYGRAVDGELRKRKRR